MCVRWGLICISLVLSEHIFLYFLHIFFGETSIQCFINFKKLGCFAVELWTINPLSDI